jgi:hypothetical protein
MMKPARSPLEDNTTEKTKNRGGEARGAPKYYRLYSTSKPYWGGSRSDPFSRLETRVRILFFIPAIRRMVAA